jgi:hypothetical protein
MGDSHRVPQLPGKRQTLLPQDIGLGIVALMQSELTEPLQRCRRAPSVAQGTEQGQALSQELPGLGDAAYGSFDEPQHVQGKGCAPAVTE